MSLTFIASGILPDSECSDLIKKLIVSVTARSTCVMVGAPAAFRAARSAAFLKRSASRRFDFVVAAWVMANSCDIGWQGTTPPTHAGDG
ncbi:hypothetical protein [Devosia submarina]|uniref:hypothetical protein n=1 Tax=Devosia submarina TaxID=1173082 RepID=UPI000D365932|nr:hypothetical protein [Devosia submarina]